jgi:hypothetical protein
MMWFVAKDQAICRLVPTNNNKNKAIYFIYVIFIVSQHISLNTK